MAVQIQLRETGEHARFGPRTRTCPPARAPVLRAAQRPPGGPSRPVCARGLFFMGFFIINKWLLAAQARGVCSAQTNKNTILKAKETQAGRAGWRPAPSSAGSKNRTKNEGRRSDVGKAEESQESSQADAKSTEQSGPTGRRRGRTSMPPGDTRPRRGGHRGAGRPGSPYLDFSEIQIDRPRGRPTAKPGRRRRYQKTEQCIQFCRFTSVIDG
ncbi:uncharacterized protein V1510DRAFT_419222 [Dipodascopsis tothii]|uniref:uncharacterized protein n=1 Tax=Dipodascopsis tothii TaxID=44089 RepID=UPI0034CF375C